MSFGISQGPCGTWPCKRRAPSGFGRSGTRPIATRRASWQAASIRSFSSAIWAPIRKFAAPRTGARSSICGWRPRDTWRDKNTGERREKTEWHRVVIFSEGLAKIAEQYLKKGSKVYLEGALQTRKWQDKDGQDRYSTEVVLQGFNSALTMLDRAGGGAGSDNGDFGSAGPTALARAQAGNGWRRRQARRHGRRDPVLKRKFREVRRLALSPIIRMTVARKAGSIGRGRAQLSPRLLDRQRLCSQRYMQRPPRSPPARDG